MPHYFSRIAHNFLFWTLLLIVFSLLTVNFVFSSIENYKTDLAHELSLVIDAPVTIGQLHAKLHGIQPELQLSQLNIANEKIKLKEIRLGVDVWDLLAQRDLLAATSITFVGAQITLIRHTDDSISLEGLKASEGQPLWLLQGKYRLLQSSITWHDEKYNASPRQISPVNLAIINDGNQHQVNLLASLSQRQIPQHFSKKGLFSSSSTENGAKGDLLLVAQFTGNPFEPQTLNGKIFLEGKNLKLNEFAAVDLPLSLKIIDGTADLKTWAQWQNGQLSTINGEATLQNATFNRPQHSNLQIHELKSHFQIKHQNETWQITLPSLQLQLPETALKGAIVSSVDEKNPAENSFGLFLEKIEISPLIPVFNFFITTPMFDANQMTGTLTNLHLFTQPTLEKFAIDAVFNDVNVNMATSNIGHLNGHLHGNEHTGMLRLNSENLTITANHLFRNPLPAIKFNTVFNWQQLAKEFQIESDAIFLSTKELSSESRFRLRLPKNGMPFMDLQSQFSINDATQTINYLPTEMMGKYTVDWLDKAFEKGRIKNGQFLFYGNLVDFPFKKGQGVFEVLFDIENAQINYAPEWLPLNNVNAQVRFYQDSLQVNVTAMAQNATIKSAEATISSIETSGYIHVVSEIEGEISQVLGFMQHTPLRPRADSVLKAIAPQGKTTVTLDLQISTTDNLDCKVKGFAQFKQAKFKIKSLDLPVQDINGAVQFTEKGVFSDTIDAVALNRPIQIRLQNDDKQTTVHVVGSASVEDVFNQLEILPLTKRHSQTAWVDGNTDYQLTLSLPYGQITPTLQVQSSLIGITLNLPAELAKSKLQKTPLSMTLTLSDDVLLPLTLNYNEQLKAAVNIDTKNKRLERGAILLGDGQVLLPETIGLSLKISRTPLALQDLLGLATSSENNTSDIHTISIYSQNARWKKSELGEFDLVLKRENDSWRGKLNSTFAQGQITQQNNSTLKLEFEKLNLAVFKQLQTNDEINKKVSINESGEKGFALSLQSEKTFWNDKPLGKLTIETEKLANSMIFKTVDLQAATHHLTMTGEWQNSQTRLHGKLDFFNTGQLFSNLGITKDISEATGNANLDLYWQGTPQLFSLEKLRGQVDLNLQNGRILSIEPGFGRILGVLALEQWLKRLQLDFSDVYSEGLTFNGVTGHFEFSQGKASTQDLTVDAIPAKILLQGDTDLVKQNVDYLADVTPKSADAVPIAGTIVGKMMSLVGKTLTGKDQDGFFFGSQYQIKGSWGNIEVIPVHENDGLIQKTWRGITEFPWLPPKLNSKEAHHD